jgi:hypothetical protein
MAEKINSNSISLQDETGASIPGAAARTDQARAMAEVQAAFIIAKRYPRDVNIAYTRIIESCKRQSLAEQALYAYPRGKEIVEGPSIRLAEVLAQCWGNLDWGLRELAQTEGQSEVEAFCIDLETNTRRSVTFAVPHVRYSKERGRQRLGDDPRDTYEVVANQGARRARACVLAVIPGDIVDAAVEQIRETLEKGGGEPLADRIRKMAAYFHEIGVTVEALEKFLGHKLEATVETELVRLKAVAKSIKDGFADRNQYFDLSGSADGTSAPKTPKTASQILKESEQKTPPPAATSEGVPSSGSSASTATDSAHASESPAPSKPQEPADTFQASNDPLSADQSAALWTAMGKARFSQKQISDLCAKYGIKTPTDMNVGQFRETMEMLIEHGQKPAGKAF